MANALILGPDLLQTTFYTPAWSMDVGLWLPDYPLGYLADDRRNRQAWSLDASTDATQFLVDLGAPRGVKGAAIPWGNFSGDATVSIYVYRDAALTDLAGSIVDSAVYRIVFPRNTTSFEAAQFWTGKMTAEQRLIFPMPWFDIFSVPVVGRYVLVQIKDTGNPDGRLKLGRFMIASGYQPVINMAYGSSIRPVDESIRGTSLGGADYYSQRSKRREFNVRLPFVAENEAMVNVLDAVYQLGKSGQAFFAWDPADTVHRHRRACVVTVDTFDDLEAIAAFTGGEGMFSTGYKLREVVA